MAKATKKTGQNTSKQFYVFGDEVNMFDTVYESLEDLDNDHGLEDGDKVTILQVVGVKAVRAPRVTLED